MVFLGCQIDLSKWNFMPRVETEFWAKKAIKYAEKRSRHIKVLDIFAGTGCIGIAILKNIKDGRVDFIDINKQAVEQIKINLTLNKISKNRYGVFQSNMFDKIKGKYDFIFANPPYVAENKIQEVQPSVLKYEPKLALFGGESGLFYIKKFLKEAKNFLVENGAIFLEFSPEQKEDIEKILAREGYRKYKFFKDQFKKYRFLKCC
ncbi:MAG: HemK family protein methyltransferase [Candidatus Nealsonbacteria bacterium]|nr:HemK family protein methyltransferase [Candidatus Nealsonbacteria bacterium]